MPANRGISRLNTEQLRLSLGSYESVTPGSEEVCPSGDQPFESYSPCGLDDGWPVFSLDTQRSDSLGIPFLASVVQRLFRQVLSS
jgi:hypothetical protein